MKAGDELTIAGDIIDISGRIIFNKGDKVKIHEVMKYAAHWSNFYNIWYDEEIWGIKLEGHYGTWFLNCFEETINLNKRV